MGNRWRKSVFGLGAVKAKPMLGACPKGYVVLGWKALWTSEGLSLDGEGVEGVLGCRVCWVYSQGARQRQEASEVCITSCARGRQRRGMVSVHWTLHILVRLKRTQTRP